MKVNLQTNQEMMSERNQEHMMMPSDPTAHLVMIHADFPFGFFKNGSNWPSHSAHSNQLRQWNADRRITEKVFDFRRIIQIRNFTLS